MDDASLRVSDADRDRAVIMLREHLLAGRLTLEEFSERVDAVLQGRPLRRLGLEAREYGPRPPLPVLPLSYG